MNWCHADVKNGVRSCYLLGGQGKRTGVGLPDLHDIHVRLGRGVYSIGLLHWSETIEYHVLDARYVSRYVVWLRFRDGTAGEVDLAPNWCSNEKGTISQRSLKKSQKDLTYSKP